IGRCRYGVMCNEDGILFDDGVVARCGADHFYLTATTSNAEAVYQWLELWRATWGMEVTMVNQTSSLAAINLAGPAARDILATITNVDLSPAACPYLTFVKGDVAGVPCLILRLGFVGELGYEIHCPSAAAAHVWQTLLAVGRTFSLRPFGVEAQRILRLEKGHLLFGVDTDAQSNPLEAGLEGLVCFDKPNFIGREPLLRFKARGPRSRLVGFRLRAPVAVQDVRSLEGCQVLDGGRPAGRVTSARHSPTLHEAIGLAWVPAARSMPGQRLVLRWRGADVPAEVAPLPFYDPQRRRLTS
ncbi:MAG: aminomethyltransferase family protein, partial [Gemmataceae bacterium]|nr:aminomethyltransferase family protein [Gemmataceae bacterium]